MQNGNSRYLKVMDAQFDLIQFYDSDMGKGIFDIATGVNEKVKRTKRGFSSPRINAVNDALAYRMLMTSLTRAQPVYVEDWVGKMLHDALEDFPDGVPLKETDIPFATGFAFIEGGEWPTPYLTPAGFHHTLNAFSWYPVQAQAGERGLSVHGYGYSTQPGRPPEFGDNKLGLVFEDFWWFGEVLDNDEGFRTYDDMDSTIPYGFYTSASPTGIATIEVNSREAATRMYMASVFFRKAMFSVWHFMNQKIAATTQRPFPRQIRRNLPKKYLAEPIIQIINLRAKEYDESQAYYEETAKHGFSSRWIVRGHWRNQWYASLGMHKPIFIHPHVKGPEGTPVKNPQKLIALMR